MSAKKWICPEQVSWLSDIWQKEVIILKVANLIL